MTGRRASFRASFVSFASLCACSRAAGGAALAALCLAGCVTTRPDPSLLGGRLPSTDTLPFTESDDRAPRPPPVVAPPGQQPAGEVAPAPATVVELAQAPGARPLRPAAPEGTWARLQAGNGVPALPDSLAGDLVREYASRPDFLSRAMQRSAPYLRHIVEALEASGMPAELALLPVIESGYDPRALSPAAAGGIWQFVPETGRRYGLRQDWLRDERRDPLAATSAALAYLGDLYRRFGNWHLALAAYNCGEACVDRAVARARAAGRTPDFAGIQPWLPAETQAYVPRFVAVRTLFRNPSAHGIALPPVDRMATVVRVALDRDADLPSVARLAGTTVDELAQLNAGVLRQVVAGEDRTLWMTAPQAARLQAALRVAAGTAAPSLIGLKAVQARPQEKLANFAARHSIDVDRLRSINGIPAALGTIRSGTLFVPLDLGEAPQPLALLSPLRMQGEEELTAQRQAVASSAVRDAELMATHPQWVESGWVPGRLQLFNRRGALAR